MLVAGSHKKLVEMGLSKNSERIGLTFTDLSLFDNLNLYHDYILVNWIPTKPNNRALSKTFNNKLVELSILTPKQSQT